MNTKILLAVAVFLHFFYALGQVPKALQRFVSLESLSSAGLSVTVKKVSDGSVLASHNSLLNLTPASTQKLITTATALEMFGPDFRFETKVYLTGQMRSSGVWAGDVIVKGGGDPTLGAQYSSNNQSAFFESVLVALKCKGINEIQGRIVGDDRAYNTEIVSWKTTWEDMGNYYAAGISALNYSDNTYNLTFKTGNAGERPQIADVEPPVPGITFNNFLIAKNNDKDSAYLYGMPFCNERYIYGTVPAGRASFSIKGDVPDPALFTVQSLIAYLKARGLAVNGIATTARILQQNNQLRIPQGDLLCSFKSDSLADIIKVTNKRSYNLYAEALMRLIASRYSADAGWLAGIAGEKSFWEKKGLRAQQLLIYDGSGLAPSNRVNSTFLCDLLCYMSARSRYKDVFLRSLAVAGEDGTLKSFLVNTSLKGLVKAKSGSFEGVLTYAGIVRKRGADYSFCIMTNAFTCSPQVVKRAIEQLLVDL